MPNISQTCTLSNHPQGHNAMTTAVGTIKCNGSHVDDIVERKLRSY